ncbi:threonine aspartase 1 isoform X5 [Pelodiscus sinensis]|uniref:threonine aspartase 1 isoform X5 n=1 Tax=Pelodiscus sinensis TaxID=13735 RepID=UPI003F6A6BF0
MQAIEKLQAGALATDAVTAALIELEDSPFTNAGMGSNLNLLGEIECDASIMDGKSLNFGAVGALSGIKNPVSVANRLLCEGQKGKLSAGRIPPCFLVGEGAYRWAVDHGIPACSPGIMTTRFSLAAFKRNKRKLELAEKVETDLIQLKKRRQSSEKENDSGTLDTVGAVVVDQEGNVAAAVSSGGLALKHPGRVGQAALYGCGCWAENIGVHNPYSTAVSTSGCGEHLVRTILARECSRALQTEDAHQALLETMQNKFISPAQHTARGPHAARRGSLVACDSYGRRSPIQSAGRAEEWSTTGEGKVRRFSPPGCLRAATARGGGVRARGRDAGRCQNAGVMWYRDVTAGDCRIQKGSSSPANWKAEAR